MSDIIQSLQRQLVEAEENLRLIQERKAEYVQTTDIPLQLIKDERRLEDQIADLQAQRHQLMKAPRCPSCGAEAESGELFCSNCGWRLDAEPTPSRPPSSSVEAHIQGDISGQVAVGNYIIQIGNVHGGVLSGTVPWQQPFVQPRPTPVFVQPRPLPSLLDREAEIDTAITALQSTKPVEFYGQSGIGKTSLLRHLARHLDVSSLPDGVIYLSARHKSLADLLQSLFDAFYESDVPFKPTEPQIRHALQDKRALVILDDVDLARHEVDELIDALPACAFVLASSERRLWREGHSVPLYGLPLPDALMLVERELGRPLSSEERPAAEALCTTLEGHPQRIVQAAAMVREQDLALAEVTTRVRTSSPAETLTAQALAPLSEAEKQVLAVLVILGRVPLHTENLAAVTQLPDPVPILEVLQRRGLVQTDDTHYSLSGALEQELRQEQDLATWSERALSHYVLWAEEHGSEPECILEETDAILRMLEWATRAGRWHEVLRLVHAVDYALVKGMRWDDWGLVLGWGHEAALILRNQSEEAWALNQRGIWARAVGRDAEAHDYLTQALHLREALGDQRGAEVIRTSLDNLRVAVPHDAVKTLEVSRRLRVFLCHASGDKPAVRALYRRLRADGIEPWLDEEDLLPGQDWQVEIPKAVRSSDVAIICLSRKSTTKTGYVQKEIRYALDVADEQPEGTIFLIPLRLEDCEVPERLRRWQWVNLFADRGYERLMSALRVRAEEVEATVSPRP